MNYKTQPRFGPLDLFGTRKTAVKVTMNKYLSNLAAGAALVNGGNPAISVVTSATRNWTDGNRDFRPDCDLLNFAANGECAAISNRNFGNPIPGSTYDPDLMHGWGRRNYNWEFSTGVQHQLLSSMSVDVSYFRRWYGNFVVTDDLSLSRRTSMNSASPLGRCPLPGGGGTCSAGFMTSAGEVGLPASNFSPARRTSAISTRTGWRRHRGQPATRRRVLLQGGTSTGKTTYDNCEIAARLPESLLGMPVFFIANAGIRQPLAFCHVETPLVTQVKFLGSYRVPKVDVQFSATYQGLPGPAIYADYVATNAAIRPSLGRDLSGGAANQTINIVHPGTMYGERLHQLDLRFAKLFSVADV